MEYEFPSFTILLTFLVFVFMILKSWKKSKNLPPGPWKLPLIGNMHQLVGALPHRCLANLAKKHGPLMHMQLGELSLFVISSPETAKAVMKIQDINFADRPHFLFGELITYDYKDIAFAPYGDYWRQLRKITSLELLSSKRTKSFRSIREEEVSNVIRSIASNAGSPINFTQILFALINDITARATLGGKCKEKHAFLSNTRKAGQLISAFTLAAMYPSIKLLEVLSGMRAEAQRLRQEADKLLDNIINDHKACKASSVEKDLVHVLLEIQDQGNLELPLTNDGVKGVVQGSDSCFDNVRETRGRAGDHVSYPVHRSHFPGFERCMEEAPGRTLNGDLYVINELQRVNAPRRMGQIHEFSLDEIYVRLYLYFVFLKTGSPIKFTEKIHSLAFGVTSRAAFGKKRNDQEIFIAVVKEATKLAAGFDFADLFPSIEAIQWISGTKYQKLTESLKTSSRNIRKTKRH
ncbi:hypothetical protein ACOSP7_030147 [Xanthoceras sorbifolium]